MSRSISRGSWRSGRETTGDRRRICGFSPIYALLRMLPDTHGLVKHYGQWPDPQAVVTYASVVF